jgi:site-specific DNA recombinase
MKRVALYARYSSELQNPTSIADQFRLCEVYAQRQGWRIVARFEDAALSGVGIQHRPGYQALLTAMRQTPPPFDVVLVEDISRLTREMGENDRLYRRLRLCGIVLIGVSDGIDTSRRGAPVEMAVKGLTNALFLDDLSWKTHRALTGLVERGLSAGGKLFGYRTVPMPEEPGVVKRQVDPEEAKIVRRIFSDYAGGRSMATIAHALNREGIPGPSRRGWSVSTIHTILHNEKYAGVWVWNKRQFLKDPDSGRRRSIAHPIDEWNRKEWPELRIVEDALWTAVQARLEHIRRQYGGGPGRPPRNGAGPVYSPYLLSGRVRCKVCGGRITAQKTTSRNGKVYRWYVCSVAKTRGAAVCGHRLSYRQDRLEAALMAEFLLAITPDMITWLTTAVNDRVAALLRDRDERAQDVKAELLRLEREAGNLIRFVREGGESSMVRAELRQTEAAIEALRVELGRAEQMVTPGLLVPRTWIEHRVERLGALLRGDPQRARLEMAKHLDGDLTLEPRRSVVAGERRVLIEGRVKVDSLLSNQEEVVSAVVACKGPQPPKSTRLTFEVAVV